jgi:hypothetical protein
MSSSRSTARWYRAGRSRAPGSSTAPTCRTIFRPSSRPATRWRGVDIATDRVEIQEDAAGAELLPIEVERAGDTVVFGWADPWSGDPTEMTCSKA